MQLLQMKIMKREQIITYVIVLRPKINWRPQLQMEKTSNTLQAQWLLLEHGLEGTPHKSVNVWLFEDFDTHHKILHYSNLVVETNVYLIQYQGRPLNKTLWKVRDFDHEAILDTIKSREDPDVSLD